MATTYPGGYAPRARPATPFRSIDDWLQVGLSFALLTIFVREACSGAARFVLDIVNEGTLWFVPDGLLIIFIAAHLARYLASGQPQLAYRALCFIGLMILPSAMGHLGNAPALALLSGTKIWMIVIGAMMLQFSHLRGRMWITVAWILFVACLIFILINTRRTMPWFGYSFEQAGVVRHAGNVKWAGGDDRLTGLSTTSFGAGCTMLLCALLINLGERRLWRKVAVYVVATVAAAISTSLTPTAGLAIALIVDVWLHTTHRLSGERRTPFSRTMLGVFLLCVIVMPLIIAAAYLNETQFVFDAGRFNSLMIRLFYSWPTAFALIVDSHYWNYLFGLGYGQVGTSAVYAGNYQWSAGAVDNLTVYIVCTYGLVGIAIMAWLGRNMLRVPAPLIPACFACGAMIFTVNCENPLAQLLLGFVVSSVLVHPKSLARRPVSSARQSSFRQMARPALP